MERTMHSKAGLGSRKRHTQREQEHKFERQTQAPSAVADRSFDLNEWARVARGVTA